MNEAVVWLDNVWVGPKDRPILEAINLKVPRGRFLAVIGPNGAGKSTLLGVIAGLIAPDAGSVYLFGERLERGRGRRLLKRIGYLRQEKTPCELPLRVSEVVAMGLLDYPSPLWKRIRANDEIRWALEEVGMEAFADADFRALSGGQRQRVHLARALVRKPGLLLLDEPTSGLDVDAQNQLYRLLKKLSQKEGMTVVMVEHDIALVTAFADAIACLNRRIYCHAKRGEKIPEAIWQAVYGDHRTFVTHNDRCIGAGGEA